MSSTTALEPLRNLWDHDSPTKWPMCYQNMQPSVIQNAGKKCPQLVRRYHSSKELSARPVDSPFRYCFVMLHSDSTSLKQFLASNVSFMSVSIHFSKAPFRPRILGVRDGYRGICTEQRRVMGYMSFIISSNMINDRDKVLRIYRFQGQSPLVCIPKKNS